MLNSKQASLCSVITGVMIQIALRWIDSNEQDCLADIDECQRGQAYLTTGWMNSL